MRNYWEGGVSVYLTDLIRPSSSRTSWIILNAVEARNTIPTLNGWGLLALALGMGAAGTMVLRRRRSLPRSRATPLALLGALLAAGPATVQGDVTTTQENGVTCLRIGVGEPFHSTDKTVANLRSVAIPNSAGVGVLWEEIDANGRREPFYAVSLDGSNVDEVRATSYDLELRYARFDPVVWQPAVPTSLLAPADGELYVVQFITQSLSEFRSAIEAQGATIYDFLPNHAYIVRIPAQARAGVAGFPFVRAVVPYHPAYRLEPFLRDNLDGAEQLFPLQRYNIRVFAPGQKTAVAARIAVLGGLVDSADAGKRMVEATLTPTQLYQVARFDEVLFIDRWSPMHPDMNIVRKMPLLPNGSDGGANYIEQTPGNYRGSGVHGEVFDFGFNTGHQDFGNRMGDLACPVAREGLIEHGGSASDNWHGARTSGIIFGNGSGFAIARGLLPCGQGIVANISNVGLSVPSRYWHTCELVQCGCCPADPPDPNCTADPNCPYEAVFQSTSAGYHETLKYGTASADMDDILFDFDLVHCQAQGNLGNQYSVPQAWAKNTISVGGVHHFDNTNLAGHSWWAIWEGWWQGASIGPAADGRIKPDLCHFYERIVTTGGPWPDPEYEYNFDGTSAATPIVCGLAGLVMEMWADDSDANGRNIFRVPVPSCNPATENCVFKRRPHMTTPKAMLINTATQYDWINPLPPGTNANIDRNKQGWGLPNIAAVYDFRNNVLIINETEVLRVFRTRSYNFVVEEGDLALRVTLVYADPPGGSSELATVNDLTLDVTAPNGITHYWGNCGLRDGLWSSSACTLGDHPYPSDPTIQVLDTVENVFVQNPELGTWTVTVRADAINQDAHVETVGLPMDADFALVVSSGTRTLGQCCFEDPVECGRSVTCASSTACTGLGYTWFADKTCAEVCVLPGEVLCCIPGVSLGLATQDCCCDNGGHVVTSEQLCPI
jgi:subtilisin family serine protease